MARPDDVVLYDLDEHADADSLLSMVKDPEQRWFARARLASLAARGLLANGVWDPKLHPRGRDGRFIRKFGWVRWLANGRWLSGQVRSIDPDTGNITVQRLVPKDGGYVTVDTVFTPSGIKGQLYVAPPPKGSLNLPDPKIGKNAPGFKKVGGQGGSNPGGLYQLADVGGPGRLSEELIDQLKNDFGLVEIPSTALTDEGPAIGISPEGRVVLSRGLGKQTIDYLGVATDDSDITTWLQAPDDPHKTEAAWGHATALADLLNDGQKVYVKHAKSELHARNEVLANRLYELAGVNVAETIMGTDGVTIGSRLVPEMASKVKIGEALDDEEAMARMRRDFVVDAWLANWDVIGLGLENTQVVDGHPYRIDAGGALLYRAQGAPKGGAFGPSVGEIDTLRDASVNPAAAKVFGKVTEDEMLDGAERVAAISPEMIKAQVEAAELPDSLADTLIARRADIIARFHLEDPYWGAPPEPKPVVEPAEGTKAPDVPEPVTAPPSIAKSLVWSTDDQTWVESDANVSDDLPQLKTKLEGYYDDSSVWSASSIEALYLNHADSTVPVFALLGGSLHEIKSVSISDDGGYYEVKAAAEGGGGLEKTYFFNSGDTLRVAKADTDLAKANLSAIMANEKVVREWSITQLADLDLPGLFAEGEANAENPVFGTFIPMTPRFTAHFTQAYPSADGSLKFTSLSPPGDPDFQPKMVWFPDSESDGHLFQVLPGTAGEGYTLMNPITGKPATPDEVESVSGKAGYAVSANDPYSLEVLEAYIQRVKATTPVEDPDTEAPTPIDPEVIEALDEKAEVTSVPEVNPAPPDYKSPPAGSKVSWYDGYYAIMAAAEEGAAAPDSKFSKFDVLAEYIEAFGTASTADVSYDELDAFIAEQFPSLKQGVDTWLMEHSSYINEPGDIVVDPDPTPTIPPPPTLPSQVDGVSPHLQVGESFQFTELPEDERVAKAQSLVGKVVFLTLTDVPDLDEDGAIDFGKLTGHTPPAALVYVEEVEATPTATRIWVRLPSGEKKSAQVHGYNPTNAHFRVVENLDANSFKTAASPVAKADGTIVYAGQVVGKWSLNDQYYWSKHYTYTLFAEHTIFGKTIKGKLHKKSGIKNFASAMLVPKAPPTKSKKASPASKKIADKVAELPTLQGAKLSDGTEAKIGDWVKSIKGGGGFVGKIVGWPDQENHPGLVFVVDTEGKQKAVKLKSQKKVPAPSDSADAVIAQMPTAYAGMKLASGETPMVGQIVEAGKPGTTQVKGVVVNINPTQGYIYILTPEGKTVVKKSGVTTLISQPDLYWDSSNAGVAGVLTTTKAKKSSKKVPGFTYPGPDGAVIEQSQAEKDAWLNDHPKRKLTKDGFVPKVGMRVRNKAGDELVVLSVASSWDSNPNRVTTWNLTQNKQTSTSTTTIEVDHAAELTGYDGNLVKKVNSVSLLNPDTATDPQVFPDGSVVYRFGIQHTWYDYKTGKTRTHKDFEFLVITPTGALYRVNNSYGGSHFSEYVPEHLKWLIKSQQPESFEKVAVVDSSAKGSLSLQPWKSTGWGVDKVITNSQMEFNDVDTPTPTPDVPEPEPTSVTPETPETPGTTPEPEVPGTPEVPETPETPETPIADEDYEAVGEPTPVSSPPTVPSGSLAVLPAPPNPNPVEKAKKADPDLPQITGSTDLSDVHPLVKKTKSAKSMREAAEQMIAQKDSTEPGSGVVYSMGDSDYIEDMAVRYNIETRPDGSEHLVMRFRLREEVSEDVMAKFVTSGEGKTGAWKLKDTKYAKELTVGDQIAVYLSSTSKLLKPENDGHPMDEPNAIVVEPPVLIGKSPANPDRDLYRVKIQTRDGEYGEVDMEQRPGGSIKTFEYDHDAPAKATGSNLHLTATAQQAGWVRVGSMSIPGQMYQDHTDSAGKVKWAGSITGLAPGTGGHHLQRTRPDGVRIDFQSAHSTEGGTGFGTTRRASISGEVRISVPLDDGKPTDVIVSQLSEAMQEVGVPPDKQTAPTDQELAMFALNKLVANYHPKYDYRAKPVKSADDPRVTEALDFMSKHLQKHLGRNVTLDDIRLHSFPNGRVAAVFSPEVAKAISKSQGSHHYHHSGVGGIGAANSIDRVLAGAVNGLLSTDERWSLGVMTTGQSSLTDMRNGAGDRVYMRTVAGTNYKTNHVILSPLMVNSSLELYTMSVNDSWGKRTAENRTMNSHSGGHEFNFKRRMEPEQIAFYIVDNPGPYIEAVKKRGVTHIGGRPIEQIIVTPQQAKSIDIEDLGIEQFADDIPITEIPGITAPAAEGDAAAAPAGAPA